MPNELPPLPDHLQRREQYVLEKLRELFGERLRWVHYLYRDFFLASGNQLDRAGEWFQVFEKENLGSDTNGEVWSYTTYSRQGWMQARFFARNPDYNEISDRILQALIAEGFTFICEDCGAYSAEVELHIAKNGSIFCDSCLPELRQCENCGDWFTEDSTDPGSGYCCTCYEENSCICVHCGDRIFDGDSISWNSEGPYCQTCFEENSMPCIECGNRCIEAEMIYDEDEDAYYCRRCYENARQVLSYSTNVIRRIGKEYVGNVPKDKIFYGIELETEQGRLDTCRDDWPRNGLSIFRETAAEIDKLLGKFCIMKRDGSLGDNGIEIVSLPATVETHKKLWQPFFDNLPRGLESWGPGSCGIHIHITRKPLGILRIGKMVVFLNEPRNRELITFIAGRYGSTYAQNKRKKLTDVYGDGKYEMLNLSHDKTIELRIFRGTLNPNHFFANLEFAEALVKFCARVGLRDLSHHEFMKFVTRDRRGFPFLHKFLVGKNYTLTADAEEEI